MYLHYLCKICISVATIFLILNLHCIAKGKGKMLQSHCSDGAAPVMELRRHSQQQDCDNDSNPSRSRQRPSYFLQ